MTTTTRRLAATLLTAATSLGAGYATTTPSAQAYVVCADSNGSALGGSVYWSYWLPMTCDVVPPQRLHLTQTPSLAACTEAGGHGWTSTYRICWDVNY